MPGETRRQRRDARRALGEGDARRALGDGDAGRGLGEDGARDVERPAAVPSGGLHPGSVELPRRGGFVRQSWAELRKVDWPSRPQVVQGTIVVLIAVAIVGVYLWGADQVLRPFVRSVLLGQ